MFGPLLNARFWGGNNETYHDFSRLGQELENLLLHRSHGHLSYPVINIWENAHQTLVKAELPGFDPKDIDIAAHGQTITIKGKREKAELKADDRYLKSERAHGEFQRTFELPHAFDAEKLKANYKNGILTLVIERVEAQKPKKIAVKLT